MRMSVKTHAHVVQMKARISAVGCCAGSVWRNDEAGRKGKKQDQGNVLPRTLDGFI
jgi:hypothetical protein